MKSRWQIDVVLEHDDDELDAAIKRRLYIELDGIPVAAAGSSHGPINITFENAGRLGDHR